MQRRLAAAAILCGMLAPWSVVIGTAAHLAADHHPTEHHPQEAEPPHHDANAHEHFEGGALHGHRHAADTPDHDHGLLVPGGTHHQLRPFVVGVIAPWTLFAPASTLLCSVPAPAVSPPRLAPLVLRT